MPTCNSCGAPILYVPSEATGSYLPIDVEPVEGGNVVILQDVNGLKRARVLRTDDLFDAATPEGPRYQSHFASCPNGPAHRKPK